MTDGMHPLHVVCHSVLTAREAPRLILPSLYIVDPSQRGGRGTADMPVQAPYILKLTPV